MYPRFGLFIGVVVETFEGVIALYKVAVFVVDNKSLLHTVRASTSLATVSGSVGVLVCIELSVEIEFVNYLVP